MRAASQRSPRLWALEGGAVSADLSPGQQHPNWPIFSAPLTERPRKLAPVRSASASCRVLSRHLAHHSHCRPPSAPPKAPADRRQPPIYPNSSPDHRVYYFLIPLPVSSRRTSVSIGGFGLSQKSSEWPVVKDYFCPRQASPTACQGYEGIVCRRWDGDCRYCDGHDFVAGIG